MQTVLVNLSIAVEENPEEDYEIFTDGVLDIKLNIPLTEEQIDGLKDHLLTVLQEAILQHCQHVTEATICTLD